MSNKNVYATDPRHEVMGPDQATDLANSLTCGENSWISEYQYDMVTMSDWSQSAAKPALAGRFNEHNGNVSTETVVCSELTGDCKRSAEMPDPICKTYSNNTGNSRELNDSKRVHVNGSY